MDLPSLESLSATLAERVVTAPRLLDPDAARQRLDEWLDGISQTQAAVTLKRTLAESPKVRALVLGLGDGSPYLWELVRADPERLIGVLNADPDCRIKALIAGATAEIATGEDEAMRRLRRMKAEGALLIALADIGGAWPVTRVTAALTDLADAAVAAAVRHLLADAAEHARYHPADPAHPEPGSG